MTLSRGAGILPVTHLKHHCIIHLDIRIEKIWIFNNSTEHDIAADLVDLGVPKQDIVLGFYPPFMREMSDYGVG